VAILVIDDEASLRRSLGAYLEDMDHDVLEAENGSQGLDVLRDNAQAVTAMIVDLNMPVMDGYSFIAEAVQEFPDIPIVVLSGVGVVGDAVRAIRLGARDFIPKPIQNMEVVEHILEKVMERARLIRENRRYQDHLELLVRERTGQLEQARRQIMQRLSRAAEYKDNETGRHVIRVGEMSALLGRALGLSEERCNLLRECAPLHDVGKIGIPDAVLLKPGKLSEEEWVTMRKHCEYGCEILGPLTSGEESRKACADPVASTDDQDNEYLRMARIVALYHHEQWAGSGYPRKLAGEEIPLEARIVATVDVFDAMHSERPYKKAMPLEECFKAIREGAGWQFDPDVARVFLENAEAITAIYHEWRDDG
jgi:putative two-component system response regulator